MIYIKKHGVYEQIRENRREKFLINSKKYFIENGINNKMSMKEISIISDISRPTLYKYFNNIDEIIFSVAEMIVNKIKAYFDTQFDINISAINSIINKINLLHNLCKENKNDLIYIYMFDAYKNNKKINEIIGNDYYSAIQSCPNFLDDIKKGQKEGIIRKDIDPIVTNIVISNLIGASFQRLSIISANGLIDGILDDNEYMIIIQDMVIDYLSNIK